MFKFANRKIGSSYIDIINKKIIELQKIGKKIIKLNIGNLCSNRPINISDISTEEFDDSNHYTDIKGSLKLRQLIVDRIKNESNVDYDVEKEINIVSGTRAGIFYTFNSILNDGDEVIIPRGTWVTYFNLLENFNAKIIIAETKKENGYKLTPEILEKYITNKTRAIVITNPGNPTGIIFSKKELESLVNVLKKHDNILLLSDEIYTNINFTNERVCSVIEATNDIELRKKIIVFNGFSKNVSMAGDRIAYVLTHNQELLLRIYNCQALINSNTNNLAQIIATKIMQTDLTDYYTKLLTYLKNNKNYVVDFISKIDGLQATNPDGALYIMIDYSELKNKYDKNSIFKDNLKICEYLLENGVAVSPGKAFEIDNSIRICFACSLEELKDGLNIINFSIEKIKNNNI